MKKYLEKLPKELRDLISLAADVSMAGDMPAYLVGGFVRDLLLEVKNLDLDILVEGDGIKFAEGLASRLKARLIRHQRFGTATITIKPCLKIDVATARKEFYPQPAHLPLVEKGGLRDDLKRRDFTINAMAISLASHDFGRLVDFFGGKKDLVEKKIRILHGLSFSDDPTRILRAVRFEKRYNFRIEPATHCLLKQAVKNKMLQKVQPQRIRDDLILLLKEESPIKQIKRLKELAGFSFIHPRLDVSGKTYRLLNSAEREINRFKKIYPRRRQLDAWLIYLMALFDSLNPAAAGAVCKRFVFTKGEEKRISSFKRINAKFIRELGKGQITPAKIFNLLEPLSYEVILMIKAAYRNRRIQERIKDFFEIYNGMRPFVHGEDLRGLGISPGPYYKKIFTRVLRSKLNGEIRTRQEEIALIKKLITAR